MASQTISSILDSQALLVQAAAEALPHQFSQCTYTLGHIRQAVYLCLSCREPRGICSACSIACHGDHEQVELFPKRAFRCDCPTRALPHPCTLHKTLEEENKDNRYGHNFEGTFCRCGREYDAANERETMIQCLACEDWFHESCLNLRERPPSREPTPEPTVQGFAGADDAVSEASSSGLPPPLIRASDYDSLICSACVRSISTVHKYAGDQGILMVVRDSPHGEWRVMGRIDDDESHTVVVELHKEVEVEHGSENTRKRLRSPDAADSQQAKRARFMPEPSSPSCIAPTPNPLAQAILLSAEHIQSTSDAPCSNSVVAPLGQGDIFLTEGWRGRWCRCNSCLPPLQAHPYLLEEEETYEPPEDPDSGLSLEELGLRALQRLPRDKALDGIRAFNDMRYVHALRPFQKADLFRLVVFCRLRFLTVL
ncbi:hypothetical protein AcW1_009984 [Taiwanofungus camphoratus]|nr:hypothetical protein AcW1_009984 [Antrodia cinnamomea]